MLTTPILNDIKTFDATEEKIVTFNSVGGSQVVGNNLVVEKIDDNTVIYDKSVDSFNFTHIIPANTLINGFDYRAKIRTKDINGNWSNFSSYSIFWCYSNPVLHIDTIDYDNQNRVYNQTVLFETTYTQSEQEQLQSYRYILYNKNKDLLMSYPERYSDGNSALVQEIAGLENGELYYLEVKTISINGNLGTTGLIYFKPFYVAPTLSVALTPKNLPEQGAIKLDANIVQIILKLYDKDGNEIFQEDIEYIDGEWINMNREDYHRLIASDGFNIDQGNFLLQLWCKELPESKVFLTLYSPQGRIEFFKSKNRIRAYKYLTNLDYHQYFVSDIVEDFQDDGVMICIKQDEGLLSIIVEKI